MRKNLKTTLISFFIMLFATSAHATVVEYTFGGAENIDTESETFITENIGDTGTILDVNVFLSVDGDGDGDGDEVYADNLDIWLSHGDEKIILISASGDSDEAYIYALLDDEATDTLPDGGAIDGIFMPVEALSAFDGMNLFGDWTLSFQDSTPFPGDGTSLIQWSLIIDYEDGFEGVPEPTPLALLGFGLLGLVLSRKRRR